MRGVFYYRSMKIDVDALARLEAVVKATGTQRAAAKQLGLSQAYIGDLLKGNRTFSDRILGKLGLRRTVIEAKAS